MSSLGFIGGGNMAEALIAGIVKRGELAAPEIMVCDVVQERCRHLSAKYGVQAASDSRALVGSCSTVILAVKPDTAGPVAEELKDLLKDRLVISIAAGIRISSFLEILGAQARVVRVMPNTPALVLQGVSVLAASDMCSRDDVEVTKGIFSSVGTCIEMDERYLDAVTALSGSGPAFCFLVLEALADGGVRSGLPRDTALQLASETMKGAAALVIETGKHPAELKDMVTSPGGTTIEGLSVLEAGSVRSAIIDAVWAAYRKASGLT
ncbi:MAG TPA: pyrroline-5-carboxylate reductase [Deltaproteobacteria bacterium]|nr:pyrroline-5-carboxylate reductase [Deltaproteobacteria bacterium]